MKKTNFNSLYTEKGERLPLIPWNQYPRPALKRNSFYCLNGEWEFAVTNTADIPNIFEKRIVVPFAPQSLLSGVNTNVADSAYIFYQKTFCLPTDFIKERVILNFGAVDCHTTVFINGKFVCNHSGGYDSFSVDITNFLKDENVITVRCFDDLSERIMPYGKQKQKRGGMWYTPVSGIWQTVWIESVSKEYIKNLKIITHKNSVNIDTLNSNFNGTVTIINESGNNKFPLISGKCEINLENPHLWYPEDPFLYIFTIETPTDYIESYFAVRTLDIRTVNSIKRLCLNGEPVFFHGILDQGYFSDGLFTPASPSCYTDEILTLKQLGFNTIRKHVKIEPQIFYYECDRLGMVVFQDMVNNGYYSFIKDTALPTLGFKTKNDIKTHKNNETRNAFIKSLKTTVTNLYNHPSIFLWTIFNEGWGQFEGNKMYDLLKELDSTRYIDTASGWFTCNNTDVTSEHVYFKKYRFKKSEKPTILSEFGGYACKVDNHIFNPKKSYGYKQIKDLNFFESELKKLYTEQIIPAAKKGLCAAIYTQVSDIEDEINGILTYDRKVCKVNKELMNSISEKLINAIK